MTVNRHKLRSTLVTALVFLRAPAVESLTAKQSIVEREKSRTIMETPAAKPNATPRADDDDIDVRNQTFMTVCSTNANMYLLLCPSHIQPCLTLPLNLRNSSNSLSP